MGKQLTQTFLQVSDNWKYKLTVSRYQNEEFESPNQIFSFRPRQKAP